MRINVPNIAFGAALFDLMENVCFLVVVESYPRERLRVARLGVIGKRLKLTFLLGSIASLGTLLGVNGLRWIWNRVRSHSPT